MKEVLRKRQWDEKLYHRYKKIRSVIWERGYSRPYGNETGVVVKLEASKGAG
jgi:hypothetical protein